jgi:purine-binding chemotaxis protein CheW
MEMATKLTKDLEHSETQEFCTFFINNRLYGIDVMEVQEVNKKLIITPVPLTPNYVYGLINLRGQISTAISLRELFGMPPKDSEDSMSVVCAKDGILISLIVDEIGDVCAARNEDFEPIPDTIKPEQRQYLSGVYKQENSLLSVLNVDSIAKQLNTNKKS